MLILDFKTMGVGVISAFLPWPRHSADHYYAAEKSGFNLGSRSVSRGEISGAHLGNFYPQLLVPLIQDALYETLSVYYSVLLGLISFLLDNKSYGPVGI